MMIDMRQVMDSMEETIKLQNRTKAEYDRLLIEIFSVVQKVGSETSVF